MYYNRSGENGDPPPRSSRIFNMENVWYFSTREGADIGPYDSQIEAREGLESFLQFIQLANEQTLQEFLQSLSHQNRQNRYN